MIKAWLVRTQKGQLEPMLYTEERDAISMAKAIAGRVVPVSITILEPTVASKAA